MNNKKLMVPGSYYSEFDRDGNCTAAVYDESFRRLLGYESEEEYLNAHEAWTDSIHPDDRERMESYMTECLKKHPEGMDFDIEYRMMTKWGFRWYHDYAHFTRSEDGSVIRADGVVFDIQEGFDKVDVINHEKLRREILDYIVDSNEDPIELLSRFAERLRVLIDCDQVIYRDLEETRIMVNSPAIEKTWSVPMEYCQQCQHFDAHHPMYKDGFTEMDNCQKGWNGIPVYKDCPIKSSLTRIVYCDGEIAGYLAIHYVQDYHKFTDLERSTIEEFSRILSMSLSRYEARQRAAETEILRRRMNMIYSLSDEFDPIIIINPDSGEYDWYESEAEDTELLTAMSVHGDNFYRDFGEVMDSGIHEEDREQARGVYCRENILKIAETGETQYTENRWKVGPDGAYLWKYNKIVRMIDENGNVYVVIGVIDTTADRAREELIEEQKRNLDEKNQMVAGLADSYDTLYYVNIDEKVFKVYALDGEKFPETNTLVGNHTDAFEAIKAFGRSPIVHPDDRHLFEDISIESIRERLAHSKNFDFRYRQNDGAGDYVWFEMEVVKYEDIDEQANAIAVGFTNRDEEIRRELEHQRQLELAREEADKANRSKSDFLFNMSHDIRTPMNAITGFTAMARKYVGDEEKVTSYLTKIDTSGRQLLSLVNQVLEMARIESGNFELAEIPVSIKNEFETMVTVLAEQSVAKSLNFKYDLDIQHNYVFADEARMNSITLNIVGNSLKYTPEGGIVEFRMKEIESRREGYGTYVLTVADTGIGMSEEFKKNLFEPFAREQTSTVSKIQGTGLGMAIVKKSVDFLGGTIEVESEPGKGTRFDITVDFRINEDAEEADEPERSIGTASYKSLRVLLVEDNELNREIAVDMLEDEGFIIDTAEDGTVAVDILREKGPDFYDFILMDIQMPFMNGFEATKIIREMYPDADIPIIALSANAFKEDKAEAIAAGMNDHVAKPIELIELLGAIAKFI